MVRPIMTMKRRDALKTIGGLAGMAGMAKLLPGCGGDDPDDGPVGITTYVFLMMENRTYDHMLGARALEGLGGDGLTAAMFNPDTNGGRVASFAGTVDKGTTAPALCDPDPPHGWAASHNQFNNGAMDGFVKQYQADVLPNGHEPMKFLTREHVPISWALADQYTSCDRWFASLMGPTLPNRAYWLAGSSFGKGINGNTEVIDGISAGIPVPSIFNRLEEAQVDWAFYAGNINIAALLGQEGPFQIDVGEPNVGHIRRLGNGKFFDDAAAGTLPTVTYIDPAFGYNDDHPPVHPILGQELIASVYTALAKSPQWKNCLLVITYDEHGGYFDHVPPPTTADDTLEKFGVDGFQQLGFRVPAIIVGPYVKESYISSVQYDHTSALKHLQNTFGLAPLNPRVEAANDLTDCLDLERLEAGRPAAPITLPVIESDEWPINEPACMGDGGFFAPASHGPLNEWADANPEKAKAIPGFDLRGDEEIYLRSIREFLRKHRT
jgi:phospholipase C